MGGALNCPPEAPLNFHRETSAVGTVTLVTRRDRMMGV